MSARNSVLVIDDDRDVVRGAEYRLGAAGYDTYCAYDGQEGIDAAEQYQPDAIVLDVRMPKMNGLAALAELRKNGRTKNIPIVMLSASLVDQQAALDAGARYFLSKPYQADTLVQALKSAMAEKTYHPPAADYTAYRQDEGYSAYRPEGDYKGYPPEAESSSKYY